MTLHLSDEEIIARNKEKQKQWRIDHPERMKAFHLKYNHKPGVAARRLEWTRQNKETINERRRRQYRLKRDMGKEVEDVTIGHP